MDVQKQAINDEFLYTIRTRVLKYYKVSDLTTNLVGCMDEIANLPTAHVNIRGGLSFKLQCQILRSINSRQLPFVIRGGKFESDTNDKNADLIALIVTQK